MKNEIINIATLSKGRLKEQAEKVFKKINRMGLEK